MSNNQNYLRPPRRSTAKESRKSPTAWSATKYCTCHHELGRCTRLFKPGHCTGHMNENSRQTKMMAGKASRSTSYHEKTKKKHYLALIKKEKQMCVILDTYNNNTQIHIVETRITHNGGSKVLSRRKQTNKENIKNKKMFGMAAR